MAETKNRENKYHKIICNQMKKWMDSIENAALIKKERKEFKLRIKKWIHNFCNSIIV